MAIGPYGPSTCASTASVWGSQNVMAMARRWHWWHLLDIVRLTSQESPPVDNGCDPDCIVCEPI